MFVVLLVLGVVKDVLWTYTIFIPASFGDRSSRLLLLLLLVNFKPSHVTFKKINNLTLKYEIFIN